ncbi:MAG: dihydroxy-acid dehydratase [Planctomycetes bacterium]|nr:dihydroxy-acid dehydratase [Planctomycetota bacterium]
MKEQAMARSDMVKSGLERTPHRSLLRATGLTNADMRRPFVAICNSYTDVIPGHAHLKAVGEYLAEAVRRAGGVPFVFNTIGICDGIAMGHVGMKYSLPSREIIADSVETMVNAHRFDAMICVPNCDKIVPGMHMGAIRANIPTVFVSGGPMEAGVLACGAKADLIDTFYAVAKRTAGTLTDRQLADYEQNACPTCGSCSGMFTANSMNCLGEALGLALPGSGTALATSPVRKRLYEQAARRAVTMARQWAKADCSAEYPFLPGNLYTVAAFRNAMALDMAMGGSTNTVLHILAIAHEAGVKFTLKQIDALSRKVPNICRVAPSSTPEGRIYHIQDIHRAGGIHTILGQLLRDKPGLLDTDVMTVTGKTLGQNIRAYSLRNGRASAELRELIDVGCTPTGRSVAQVAADLASGPQVKAPKREKTSADDGFDAADVIRTAETAFTQRGGLVVLYGNIAAKGSVVKLAGVDPAMYTHSGPARIYESQEAACEGILAGQVKPGDVVVIRNEGPKGGPGMQEMLAPTSYIKGAGLGDKCALITDGRFSGGTAGACIGHVSPEAAAGGEIGLLANGDIIEIDIFKQTLNARVTQAEFARRRKAARPRKPRFTTGWLARYAAMATSADTGGVLETPKL